MSEQGKKPDAMLSTEALSIAACIARENDCRFQLALAHSPIAVLEQDLGPALYLDIQPQAWLQGRCGHRQN